MIQLSKRQRDCLLHLCQHNRFVTIGELARTLGVSARSVRADLDHIEAFSKDFGCVLERTPGKGVRLVGGEASRDRMIATVSRHVDHTLSANERVAVCTLVLTVRRVATFQELANFCCVSRQTVAAHFDEVEHFISASGLAVQRERGTGLCLHGCELDIRRCFMGLISRASLTDVLADRLDELLSTASLFSASRIVADAEKQLSIVFGDVDRPKNSIAYVLDCVGSGFTLEGLQSGGGYDHDVWRDMAEGFDGQSFQQVFDLLGNYLQSEADRVFLAVIILSYQSNRSLASLGCAPHDDEAALMSRELVDALRRLHAIDDRSVESIVDRLTAHVRAAIYRYRSGTQIQSQMPQQIMASSPLLYEFTCEQMRAIECHYGLDLNESEIAYIAMYLDTIYEMSAQETVALQVVFVCSFGLASSSMLMMRLSKALAECSVKGPFTIAEAEEFLAHNHADFIISTNKFCWSDVPVIIVDPLLGDVALNRVKSRLAQASYAKKCEYFLHSYANMASVPREPTCIGSFVQREDVQVGVDCDDWARAIRIAANPLLERGVIEQRYVERMIKAVEDFGPYMVLTPGTAYVHAGVNDGIHANCVAVCVLNHEIPFGAEAKKHIQTIVVLGIFDKTRSDLLSLAPIFERSENIQILSSGDVDVDTVLGLHA